MRDPSGPRLPSLYGEDLTRLRLDRKKMFVRTFLEYLILISTMAHDVVAPPCPMMPFGKREAAAERAGLSPCPPRPSSVTPLPDAVLFTLTPLRWTAHPRTAGEAEKSKQSRGRKGPGGDEGGCSSPRKALINSCQGSDGG